MASWVRTYAVLLYVAATLPAIPGGQALPTFESLVDGMRVSVSRGLAGISGSLTKRADNSSSSGSNSSETDVWILSDTYAGHTFFE
jgi:hypothetical protein